MNDAVHFYLKTVKTCQTEGSHEFIVKCIFVKYCPLTLFTLVVWLIHSVDTNNAVTITLGAPRL